MRIHQGAWVAWATAAAIAVVVTTNPFYLVPLIALAWVVHATHARPGPSFRAFKVFLAFAVFAVTVRVALILVTPLVPQAPPIGTSVLAAGFLEGLSLGTLLVVFGTFNSVSDPYAILRLTPRRFHEPALAAALALSIAPRTIATAAKVREAQRLRGMDTRRIRTLPALAVPVLENGMEEALSLAESMDARGHGRGRRSRYRPERWSLSSTVVAAGGVTAAAMFASAFLGDDPTLRISTFPLEWPDVSEALLVGLLGLAAPVMIPGPRR